MVFEPQFIYLAVTDQCNQRNNDLSAGTELLHNVFASLWHLDI